MKKIIFLLLPIILMITLSTTLPGEELSTYEKLLNTAREKGSARIIIKLDVKNLKALTEKSTQYKVIEPGLSFPAGGIQADLELQQAIDTATYSVLYQLNGKGYRLNHTYSTLPYLALEVSPETLALLPTLPQVLDIFEDRPRPLADYPVEEKKPLENPFTTVSDDRPDQPMLTTSVNLIGAKNAWSMGYTGSGWYVAILDTGIRSTHEFFTGKTIVEACFSTLGDCPNGDTEMYGTGAAAHYENTYEGYDHGTHVSGIAAGKYGTLTGVAKDSKILAVQIFSRFSATDCGGDPCVMSYDSDQAKGLEYVYSLRSTYSIAAVNMSLGGGSYSSACNGVTQQTAMNNLKSVRIATVVATGNDGYCGYISSPACIPAAVAVGASNDSDVEASFNNWSKTLQELFAPGVDIYSSTGDSNSSYASWSGTSMATPHVTGAWALLRQASSSSSVDTILAALQNTGQTITTLCSSGGSCPRIQVDEAIEQLVSGSSSITVVSPNGGETWAAGTTQTIFWNSAGTISNVKIEYSTNSGSSWTKIITSTANDGSYSWTIPTIASTKCKVRIKDASSSTPSDISNAVFSIVTSTTPTITITSPNGGEKLKAGTSHTITWTTTGTVGKVKIQYSTNNGGSWTNIITSTANDGSHKWAVPSLSSSQCLIKIIEASAGSPTDTSNKVFTISIPVPSKISLNRTKFYYGAILSGTKTGSQTLRINNSGGGTLNWSIASSASWLSGTPTSGSGAGVVTLSVNTTSLAAGTYTGTITVTATGASNTPQTVSVTLTVKSSTSDQSPFGDFATPVDGSSVSSSVPVTGWVLDDIDVASVKIYNGSTYIGNAVFVEGARSDIESAYSTYPKNYQAGWGYMLLTNFLPNGGNGTYTLYAKVTDSYGHVVTLGSKTVYCNNAAAVKPFGAIDSPTQGGTASGSSYTNSGWVLTPQPNMIPTSGSTIEVYVDSLKKGTATYNVYRSDIAALFPGYANTNGASGWFKFNTTGYSNGVHSIYWIATDDGGNAEGIGSRFFIVQNTGADMDRRGEPACSPVDDPATLYTDWNRAVTVTKGYRKDAVPQTFYPGDNGITNVVIHELERVVIDFGGAVQPLESLPIGSTLDRGKGIFYWIPGPGFIGNYKLLFIDSIENRAKQVNINILPK